VRLLFLLLLLANADFGSVRLTFNFDVRGHIAITKPPTDGRVGESGAELLFAVILNSVAANALFVDGKTGPTRKTTSVFGHERTFETSLDGITLHETLQKKKSSGQRPKRD
jgi:hypothetical protein